MGGGAAGGMDVVRDDGVYEVSIVAEAIWGAGAGVAFGDGGGRVPDGEEDFEIAQLIHLPVIPFLAARPQKVGPGDAGAQVADLQIAEQR